MGTRSTYRVIQKYKYEEKTYKKPICLMYVQYDGYPDGHPAETAEWLASGNVVNGISMAENRPLIFNGAGCLAAQLVARMKSDPGGVYLHSLSSRGKSGEDYVYDIVVDEDQKTITFIAYENYGSRPKIIFNDAPQHFAKFLKERK